MVSKTLHHTLFSFLSLFPLLGFFSIPYIAGAQILPLVPCTDNCGFADLVELVRRVISFLIFLAVTFAVFGIAFAGVLYLTAGEDSGKVTRAHGIFVKVALGLAVALGAWVIVNAIAGTFLNQDFLSSQFWFLREIQ